MLQRFMDQSSRTRYIYVNGVVAASHTHGVGEWTSSEVDAGPVTIGGESDGSAESTNRFQGQIDEVSYWNKALSQTEIRDLMCKSLIGSEPNLYGYWNFDGAGMGVNNVPDLSSNGLTGTMKNMNATEIVVSSIPLGTASAYSYPVSWAGFSLTLGSTSKGNMEVKTVSGTPVSVHIYRVDNVPNYTTGLSGLGNNNTYFGVFIVGGTSPTYTSVFDYSNYPDANTNEATLILNSRIDNSITTWADASATLNTGLNTLTKTGNNNRAEFILSNPSSPLPIKLLSFEANFNVDKVDLKWITASEINNDYFTIEKSKDLKNWEIVSNVSGAGNSNTTIEYLDVDYSPFQGISYYRLKQTDFDGAFTYSNIVPVRVEKKQSGEFSLFPNPLQSGEHLKIQFSEIIESEVLIVLRDTKGEEFFSKVVLNYEDKSLIAIPIDKTIPSGIYLVTASSENQIYNQKLIIKGSSNN
ncbi:MAG: T9SS type A sorting domain-containing protein [Flavobacteriales bacterium]|nr:T9SS type A sorting domain-containing protein [Flavobacteriales bacterium]